MRTINPGRLPLLPCGFSLWKYLLHLLSSSKGWGEYSARSRNCQYSQLRFLAVLLSFVEMPIRLRYNELLEAAGLTPYRFSKLSGGRVSMSTAYRLDRERGRLQSFDAVMLDALCDVLDVEPGELLEREGKRKK